MSDPGAGGADDEASTRIEPQDLQQLEKAMTRSVFRGAFYAILLTSAIFWALAWVLTLRVEQGL